MPPGVPICGPILCDCRVAYTVVICLPWMGGAGMSRILTITISALMLAGCADIDSYDRAAKPAAGAAMRHAIDDCKARLAAHDITSTSEWASCSLDAERGYFTAIKLKNMRSFDAYA